MRRRVIDYVGLIRFKDLIDPAAVPDRADENLQIQVRVCVLQLKLNGVGVVFVDIENNQLLRLVGGDSAAQLAADRPPPP